MVTTRSKDRARQFENRGLVPILLDVTKLDSLARVPQVDTIVFAVGYDSSASYGRREVYLNGLKNVVGAVDSPCRFIFVSTTGVYGDAAGSQVTESSPTDPARESGQAFADAEAFLKNHPMLGKNSVTLRMAGIYGPSRVPRIEAIRQGSPIPAASGSALNLIHVDDAVQAISLAAEAPNPSPVYNVSDGSPVPRTVYYEEVARLLDAPDPSFVEPDPKSPTGMRSMADRTVSNALIVQELGFQPTYVDYQAGLKQILGGA